MSKPEDLGISENLSFGSEKRLCSLSHSNTTTPEDYQKTEYHHMEDRSGMEEDASIACV
jgi:hypothetical protein